MKVKLRVRGYSRIFYFVKRSAPLNETSASSEQEERNYLVSFDKVKSSGIPGSLGGGSNHDPTFCDINPTKESQIFISYQQVHTPVRPLRIAAFCFFSALFAVQSQKGPKIFQKFQKMPKNCLFSDFFGIEPQFLTLYAHL